MGMPLFPLPEALEGEPWDVRRGSGSCDTKNREMLVPLGHSAADHHIRCHEMAHAKITPRVPAYKQCEKFSLDMRVMQVVEDLRVHQYLVRCGIHSAGVLFPHEMAHLISRTGVEERDLALLLVASLHTDDYERAVSEMALLLPAHVLARLVAGVAMIDARMKRGRNLFRPIGFRNGTVPCCRLFEALFPHTRSTPNGDTTIPSSELAKPGTRTRRSVKWGKLSIENIPLSETRAVDPWAKISRCSDEGSLLRAVHRMPVDGRVFRRSQSTRGGSVLIDGSGSMSLSSEDLSRILITAPAATIAIYSGSGRSGRLTVIAQRGRIGTDAAIKASRYGRGNIVDGPALAWLAQQQSPRVWVSDGMVTGENDMSTGDLSVDAEIICNKANIRRVEKTATATHYLRDPRRN